MLTDYLCICTYVCVYMYVHIYYLLAVHYVSCGWEEQSVKGLAYCDEWCAHTGIYVQYVALNTCIYVALSQCRDLPSQLSCVNKFPCFTLRECVYWCLVRRTEGQSYPNNLVPSSICSGGEYLSSHHVLFCS